VVDSLAAEPPVETGADADGVCAGVVADEAGAVLSGVGAVVTEAVFRCPLSTKPATPCADSGAPNACALTVRPGRESAPMVCRTPPASLVTTSTWPLKTTQSPGCGW
jgi:hypothetical protein